MLQLPFALIFKLILNGLLRNLAIIWSQLAAQEVSVCHKNLVGPCGFWWDRGWAMRSLSCYTCLLSGVHRRRSLWRECMSNIWRPKACPYWWKLKYFGGRGRRIILLGSWNNIYFIYFLGYFISFSKCVTHCVIELGHVMSALFVL